MHLNQDIIYVYNVVKDTLKVEAYNVHSNHQLSGSGSNSLEVARPFLLQPGNEASHEPTACMWMYCNVAVYYSVHVHACTDSSQ